MLLFDKLPFIYYRLIAHVLITVQLSLWCGVSDVRGVILGTKEVLL